VWIMAWIACTPEPREGDDDDDSSEPTSSLQGTSTRTRTVDGIEACSETHELAGTPYTGDCPGCLFAFEITATAPQGSGDCPPDAHLTWAADGMFQDIRLALTDSHEVLWGTSSPTMTYYGGTAPPEDWVAVGQGSWDGETLELQTSLQHEEFEYSPDLFEECGEVGYPVLTTFGPTQDAPGTVQCDTSTFDIWEFEATEGAVARIWVDNLPDVAPEDTLGPMMGVTDAETCLLAIASPTFPCASSPGPEPLQCPGLELVAPATGSYRVIVLGAGEPCQEGVAGYVLRGNLDDTPLTFSQTLDEAIVGHPVVIEEQASLIAHVLP
jgi:hypothetical protein